MGNYRHNRAFNDIVLPNMSHLNLKCDWCNKPLQKRHVVHKNQCQDKNEHRFCSRDCKEKWCYSKK